MVLPVVGVEECTKESVHILEFSEDAASMESKIQEGISNK